MSDRNPFEYPMWVRKQLEEMEMGKADSTKGIPTKAGVMPSGAKSKDGTGERSGKIVNGVGMGEKDSTEGHPRAPKVKQ